MSREIPTTRKVPVTKVGLHCGVRGEEGVAEASTLELALEAALLPPDCDEDAGAEVSARDAELPEGTSDDEGDAGDGENTTAGEPKLVVLTDDCASDSEGSGEFIAEATGDGASDPGGNSDGACDAP